MIESADIVGDAAVSLVRFWGLKKARGEAGLIWVGNFHCATSFFIALIKRSLSEIRAARLDGGSSFNLSGI